MANIAYKIEINPTQKQREILEELFKKRKCAWNWGLGLCRDLYQWKLRSKKLGIINKEFNLPSGQRLYSIFAKEYIKPCKEIQDIPIWYTEGHSQVYSYAFDDLHKSFKRFFDDRKKGMNTSGPKFKSSSKANSFKTQYGKIEKTGNSWKIGIRQFESKYGLVKSKEKLNKIQILLDGGAKIANITVSKKCNKFYASINIVDAKIELVKDIKNRSGKMVGSDWGINKLLVLSDGRHYAKLEVHNPNILKVEKKLKRKQKNLSKKEKGSNNWNKCKQEIQSLNEKIERIRSDYNNKITHDLTNNKCFNVIELEDLKIKNMTKSAKGTIEIPGSNVRQKSGLNRVILNHSFYSLKTKLEQKGKWYGTEIIYKKPQYTSQKCSSCGNIDKDSRNKEKYKCVSCGFEIDADLNAANNSDIPSIERAKKLHDNHICV